MDGKVSIYKINKSFLYDDKNFFSTIYTCIYYKLKLLSLNFTNRFRYFEIFDNKFL